MSAPVHTPTEHIFIDSGRLWHGLRLTNMVNLSIRITLYKVYDVCIQLLKRINEALVYQNMIAELT